MNYKKCPKNWDAVGIRYCKLNMKSVHDSASGFRWPKKGYVRAPDWDPNYSCGFGLHFFEHEDDLREFLENEEVASYLKPSRRKYLVILYNFENSVSISNGKGKVQHCWVHSTHTKLKDAVKVRKKLTRKTTH